MKNLVSNLLVSNVQLINCHGHIMERPASEKIRGIVVGPKEEVDEFFEEK